uniref:DUF3078 domain-containing protein n=1 Tax=Prevotella sp. TaxID=59823 RepID=UPI003FED596B
MKIKFGLLVLAFLSALSPVSAQRKLKKVAPGEAAKNRLAESYADSLLMCRQRIDSMKMDSGDSRYAQLFTPLTFYHGPAARMLRLKPQDGVMDSLGTMLDQTLMEVYLKRPDLVRNTESHLKEVGAPLVAQSKPKKNHPDIVEQVAPKAIEVDAAPMDIVITRPNFWTIGGDYYLQFLQNYVSDNWYKGGESNYSVLGRVTMFANYNNKQKIKWDNKVEMRLGYQTSKGDTVHTLKTSDDMIRYTGKLGLQASKKWYYTIQLVGQTQFTHGYKSNDKKVYSDFFSPFNLNLSVGMDYNVDWFNHRLKGSAHLAPLAFNWKYVGRASLATRYGLDEGKHGMTDYGSECTFDLAWQIADNIKWKTRLWGYTTYKRAEIEWENTITFQFNRYISTNIFLYPRFDDGVKRKDDDSYWQFKEFMSVGFSYSF